MAAGKSGGLLFPPNLFGLELALDGTTLSGLGSVTARVPRF